MTERFLTVMLNLYINKAMEPTDMTERLLTVMLNLYINKAMEPTDMTERLLTVMLNLYINKAMEWQLVSLRTFPQAHLPKYLW